MATAAAGVLASDFEVGDTVDGIVLALEDRVLIKNQVDPTENGIYVVAAAGAPTRADDADDGEKLLGAIVVVLEGTANADTMWLQTTDAPIIVGTSAIVWIQYPVTTLQAAYDASVPADRTIFLAVGAG